MDQQTLAAYDREAAAFAQDWETQPPPSDLHGVVRRFFTPGPTADIGCGSGRDTAWLTAAGYPARGFDASDALLDEARRRHPGIEFARAILPDLADMPRGAFANVLCETVIMHLDPAAAGQSVSSLLSLLRPGGILYLSWRVTRDRDLRDGHGRLYAALPPEPVLRGLASAEMLLDEETESASSGKMIRRLVARALPSAERAGG